MNGIFLIHFLQCFGSITEFVTPSIVMYVVMYFSQEIINYYIIIRKIVSLLFKNTTARSFKCLQLTFF